MVNLEHKSCKLLYVYDENKNYFKINVFTCSLMNHLYKFLFAML